jgi:hypothetical protein
MSIALDARRDGHVGGNDACIATLPGAAVRIANMSIIRVKSIFFRD